MAIGSAAPAGRSSGRASALGAADADRERRRERRAFVRRSHPDVGGDPAEFAAGLADRSLGAGHVDGAARIIVVRARGPRAWVRRLLAPRRRAGRRPLR